MNSTSLSRNKIFIFYLMLAMPFLAIGIYVYYILFMTDLPQTVYLNSIRNIYFDCIDYVDTNYAYKNKPGLCVLNNIEYRTVIHNDKYGFRNKDTSARADVVLIGDSHTHGVGLNDSETTTAVLRDKYGYNTKNLGVGSYATQRELEVLKAYTNGEKVIVLQYCDNDAPDNLQSLEMTHKEYAKKVQSIWQGIAKDYKIQKERGLIVPLTDLSQRLLHADYHSKKEFYASRYSRNMKSEADAFARIFAEYTDILKDKKIIIFESAGSSLNHPQFKTEFERALSKYTPSLNVTVLDSYSFLTKDNYYFLDDHLNPSGAARIAEEVNSTILKDKGLQQKLTIKQ